jgi:hypothetical protein
MNDWIAYSISLGVKRLGLEAYHSPPYSADVKNSGTVTPLPHTSSLRGTYLVKHKDSFTFKLSVTVTNLASHFLRSYLIRRLISLSSSQLISDFVISLVSYLVGQFSYSGDKNKLKLQDTLRPCEVRLIHGLFSWVSHSMTISECYNTCYEPCVPVRSSPFLQNASDGRSLVRSNKPSRWVSSC